MNNYILMSTRLQMNSNLLESTQIQMNTPSDGKRGVPLNT